MTDNTATSAALDASLGWPVLGPATIGAVLAFASLPVTNGRIRLPRRG